MNRLNINQFSVFLKMKKFDENLNININIDNLLIGQLFIIAQTIKKMKNGTLFLHSLKKQYPKSKDLIRNSVFSDWTGWKNGEFLKNKSHYHPIF